MADAGAPPRGRRWWVLIAVVLGVPALAVVTFLGVRHWQATRPPERLTGTGSPLSSAPSPQCARGSDTTTVPAASSSSQSLDDAALAWAHGRRGLKTYQVTLDRLPVDQATAASVAFADVTRTIVARIELSRVAGGGWVLTQSQVCS